MVTDIMYMSPPVLADDVRITSNRYGFTVYNLDSGESWSPPPVAETVDEWGAPKIVGETVLAIHGPRGLAPEEDPEPMLYGLDVADGSEQWTFSLADVGIDDPGTARLLNPVAVGDTIYLSNPGSRDEGSRLVAVRPAASEDEGETRGDDSDDSDDDSEDPSRDGESDDEGSSETGDADADESRDDEPDGSGSDDPDDDAATDEGDASDDSDAASDGDSDNETADGGDGGTTSDDAPTDTGDTAGNGSSDGAATDTDTGTDGDADTTGAGSDGDSNNATDTNETGTDGTDSAEGSPGFTTGAGLVGGGLTLEWLRRRVTDDDSDPNPNPDPDSGPGSTE